MNLSTISGHDVPTLLFLNVLTFVYPASDSLVVSSDRVRWVKLLARDTFLVQVALPELVDRVSLVGCLFSFFVLHETYVKVVCLISSSHFCRLQKRRSTRYCKNEKNDFFSAWAVSEPNGI